ncbi:MAG: class I tRNA ligase family protein [Candidatus Parvarchaeota archaeon]|nr:class I tRNA ligase family protein [Candidatus Rehaiarchaeum fermentans]
MLAKYITTPIFYVNDKPHIGHAYTVILADVLSRWFRINNYDVFFLTGTDEHGNKIEKTAREKGMDPKDFVDQISGLFKSAFAKLDIQYSRFIRTTDKDHEENVKRILKYLYDKGDIYKGTYEGYYCLPDESYFTESEIIDGKCPVCGRPVQKISEEAYFFRLSKYKDQIINFLNSNSIIPDFRVKEQLNRLKNGLFDLDISRKTVKWGIELPFDNSHTTYVWFDALLNYLTAINFDLNKYWPADLQIIGKEILWFHSVIWIGILSALNLPPPKKILAHGFWLVNGQKMSKSLGNVIDPVAWVEKYGSDAVRYALISEKPAYNDGDISEEKLISKINSDLADELGNLVYRVLSLSLKNNKVFEGDDLLSKELDLEGIKNDFENYDAFSALHKVMDFVRYCNKFVNDKRIWELKGADLDNSLYNLLNAIKAIGILIYPFMPNTGLKIVNMLGYDESYIDIKNLKFSEIGPIKSKEILFNKITN